jgi:predicted metal-dependent hydrolase
MKHRNAAPTMTQEEILHFQNGVEEFNAGRFFECHEILEDLWHGIRGEARDFFQGLIQVAVGFYHLDNGNRIGSRSQLEKGLARLEAYADSYMGIAVDEFRRETARWLARIIAGQEIGGHVHDLPKLRKSVAHKTDTSA